ncbi:flagellar basal body L-ring protein FlgH [Planctellipticum variicoloris]|jgi:flagellar L-ring protein precursor FlgH|uniref:flagellar basal body L-ring protein FlgH n=1 Tax=Planctellipticum variicoloris TaxID=3064265 RepID=UPI00301374B9|nr:flagellar basal body L-ring protein FlgH [Planctomycetaceae bacterium SH412]
MIRLLSLTVLAVVLSGPCPVLAQPGPFIDPQGSPRMQDYSWVYLEPAPPPPQIKVHDIITIEVDEKAEVIVNSRFNRQRNGTYTAQLKEFIRLVNTDGYQKVVPAAASQPTIDATLTNRLQTIGQSTDLEGITYKIGATVVDILPNGTIVLEARKSIRTNQDFFEYRLTGRVDKAKISPTRSARTEDIAELRIERKQRGKVFDSTKVNWGGRILDTLLPF